MAAQTPPKIVTQKGARGNMHHQWTQGWNQITGSLIAQALHQGKRFVGHGGDILVHLLGLKTAA